ncbi:MAG: sigma-70 family RNA polymerase sigma factor [Planctomycetes bacterium]|nr:sigma-70 family RNA polymerase sigma factor [Planctomycetota bacterium]
METSAVAALYAEHGRGLLLYARSTARDDGLAEDALQEVFGRLLARKGGLAAAGNARAYLYESVRNATLNLLRTRRRARGREEKAGRSRPLFTEPEDLLAEREALEAALDQLPEEQREVVVLKVWGDLTFEGIGAALAISPNTAASRYRYGMEKLRQAFSEVSEHGKP